LGALITPLDLKCSAW